MIEFFFKLIRSGLYGTQLSADDVPANVDWDQVVELARRQTLLGVMADAVLRLPPKANVPPAVQNRLMASAVKIGQAHAMLDGEVARVVQFYNANGIPTVLLKGQGVARSYRNPLMRQCGDIDLYIGIDNYDKATRIAQEKLESANSLTSESEKHYHFNTGKATVELHRIAAQMSTPMLRRAFQKWMVTELEDQSKQRRADIGGAEVRLPSPLFDAFFIFYHAWYHLMYGGIGLRQVCDWTMILDRYYGEIDTEALGQMLRRFKLLKPWQIMGNIVVDNLGLSAEKMPFYNPAMAKKSKKTLDLILDGGNFGFYAKGYIANSMQVPLLRRKWRALRKVTRSYMLIAPIIPLEATCNFAMAVPMGGLRTICQLVQGKK